MTNTSDFPKKEVHSANLCNLQECILTMTPPSIRDEEKMRGKPGSGYEGDLEISLRLCPMPSLTEEDRDVTFWSDLLPP